MERTFVMVKPNGVARGLVGEVVARFERRGFALRGMKALRIDRALAEKHYAEHIGKPFFESLAEFITSGPVVAMVWEGREAITVARAMMGVTDSRSGGAGYHPRRFLAEQGRERRARLRRPGERRPRDLAVLRRGRACLTLSRSTSGSGGAPDHRRTCGLRRPRPRLALAAAQDAAGAARYPVPRRRQRRRRGRQRRDPAHTVQQNARGKAEEVLAREQLRRASWCSAWTPWSSAKARSSVRRATESRGHGLRAASGGPPPRGVQRPVRDARRRWRWRRTS